MELKGNDAAHFILGYLAALYQLRRKPAQRLLAMAYEASDVISGGSFRGPLAVWEMEAYANELAKVAALKACAATGKDGE